MSNCKHQSAI